MRTFFGAVLLVLGVPVLLAGGAAAVVVGPDDTVGLLDEDISTDAAVLATTPSVLDMTGPTVHVSANAQGAETFVGVAHPIHVDSYLDGVTAEEVTDVSWRGDMTHELTEGERQAPEGSPAELGWWSETAAGAGVQQVSVELSDEPMRLVVANTDLEPATGLQVNVDVEIDQLFTTTLIVAAAGLVLVVGGILLIRAGRRRRKSTAGPADDGTGGADPDDTRVAQPTRMRRGAAHSARYRRSSGTLPRIAVVGAGAAALAGCAQLPGDADHAAYSTVPAVTPEAASDFFAHYTEVNNQANTEQDTDLIATVETGTLLTSSQMAYEIQQAQDQDPLEPFTVSPSLVAPPAFDSYPMWLVAVSEPDDDQSGPGYYLVTRETAAAPWLVSLSVYPSTDADTVEPVVDGGVAQRVETPQAGEEVLAAILEYAETGSEPDGIDVSQAGGLGSLHEHGLQVSEDSDEAVSVNRECSMDGDDLPWVATDGGALTMMSVSCTQTVEITDEDFHMRLDENGFGTLPGDTRLRESEITHGVSFVLVVNDDGSATVIGEAMLPYAMDFTEQ